MENIWKLYGIYVDLWDIYGKYMGICGDVREIYGTIYGKYGDLSEIASGKPTETLEDDHF